MPILAVSISRDMFQTQEMAYILLYIQFKIHNNRDSWLKLYLKNKIKAITLGNA
jgi:hypothetical protein